MIIHSFFDKEKTKFKKLRVISEFDYNRFSEPPDIKQIQNLKILDIYFKAKTNEVNKKYDLALFYYEILINNKEKLKNQFQKKASEIEKSYKDVEKELLFELNILQGDIYYVKDKKLEALESYEEGLKLKPISIEAKVKYNELLADLLTESRLYTEAIKAYNEAIKSLNNRFREKKIIISAKKKIAKNLKIANLRLPLISTANRLFAKIIEKKNDFSLINAKEMSILNQSQYILGSLLGIFIIYLIFTYTKSNNQDTQYNYTYIQPLNLSQIAEQKGDAYFLKFKKYGFLRVHVLDSAIKAYHRSLTYEPNNINVEKKYKKTKHILSRYNQIAQERLKKNPKKYYRAVKPMREGLQLVQYKYDPNNPNLSKFGYIDKKHNLVIPPLFDFDYNLRMKPGWESFHNGHAYVCIAIDIGDTAYFLINRFGKRASKIYYVSNKK